MDRYTCGIRYAYSKPDWSGGKLNANADADADYLRGYSYSYVVRPDRYIHADGVTRRGIVYANEHAATDSYDAGYRDGHADATAALLDALANYLRANGDSDGAAYYDAIRDEFRAHRDAADGNGPDILPLANGQ